MEVQPPSPKGVLRKFLYKISQLNINKRKKSFLLRFLNSSPLWDGGKSYKPVSRILFPIAIGRPSFICPDSYLSGSICLPWIMSAIRRILNEPFSPDSYRDDPIRGISACKVCPQIMLPLNAVSSYLTFSPFHFLFPSLPP